MNLKDEHIGLWMYLGWEQMNRVCVTFHVQHRSDSGGHYKQQNMLGQKKKIFFSSILIDSLFYESI